MTEENSSEKVLTPDEEKDINSITNIVINKTFIDGKRAIALYGSNGSYFLFGAKSAQLIAVAMFGLSENYEVPVSKEELESFEHGHLIKEGDLVHHKFRGDGEYPGSTFLVWEGGPRTMSKATHVSLAPRDGGGIFDAPISDLTLVKVNYRDFKNSRW